MATGKSSRDLRRGFGKCFQLVMIETLRQSTDPDPVRERRWRLTGLTSRRCHPVRSPPNAPGRRSTAAPHWRPAQTAGTDAVKFATDLLRQPSCATSASVTWAVDAVPPRSAVRVSVSTMCPPSRRAPRWPRRRGRDARASSPPTTAPIGLAMPFPAMSGAEPWTGSNIEGCCLVGSRFADGAIPIDPATAARDPRGYRRTGSTATTTSKGSGCSTTWRRARRCVRCRSARLGAALPARPPPHPRTGSVSTIRFDFVAEVT